MFFFKSKEERERERLQKDIEKTERQIASEKELRELERRRQELDTKKARHDDRSFRDKVFDTSVKLNELEKEFITNIFSEANNIKQLEARHQNTEKAKARLKNSYLSLVMVKHAKSRLVEIQSERDWNLAMKDLSGAIKTMNSVSTGSNIIQKMLFRFRVKKMGWLEENESGGWFNKKTNEQVSESELQQLQDSDPVDLLVAEDVFDSILENPSISFINDCAENSEGVDSSFEDVARMSNALKAADSQGGSKQEAESDYISDEELEQEMSQWGGF